MRTAVALALSVIVLSAPPSRAQPGPQGRPGLIVLLVVDQMRADYVQRFGRDWTGGLKRLVAEGAVFENAAYPYATTVTCAGHATVSTGAFPRTHGIVANAWWDRDRNAVVTCTEDPRSKDIGYQTPVESGDSAWRLQAPTLADAARAQRGGRVAAVALKDRSAIMLAGRGAGAVTWFSESLEGWVTSSAYTDNPVPAVRDFLAANPIKADFGKAWTPMLRAAGGLPADDQPGEAPPAGWTRTFPHVLNGLNHTPDAAFVGQWQRSPFADAYVARMAAALVERLPLGRGQGTDLLAVSFSTPDMVGHAFGPRSLEERDLYAHLDRTLGALFDRLDAAVGKGRWVAGLSADHGVTPIVEQVRAEGREAGRVTVEAVTAGIEKPLRSAFGGARFVAQVIGNDIWLAAGVMDRLRAQPSELAAVLKALGEVPGVSRVFTGEQLRDAAAAGDPVLRAAALSYFPGRSGDIVVALKPGWVLGTSGAQHGSATPDDQRVPLILYGAGIKAGRYADRVTPADLAPTLGAAAGIGMPKGDGRVLDGALAR